MLPEVTPGLFGGGFRHTVIREGSSTMHKGWTALQLGVDGIGSIIAVPATYEGQMGGRSAIMNRKAYLM